jgi:hypothetical protein
MRSDSALDKDFPVFPNSLSIQDLAGGYFADLNLRPRSRDQPPPFEPIEPASMSIRVVFPEDFDPKIPKTDPASTEKAISRKTQLFP